MALSDIVMALKSLAVDSEREFLDIGQHLQGLAVTAKEISNQGLETAKFLTGHEMVQAIEDLDDFLSRIQRYLNHTDAQTHLHTELLKSVYEIIERIDQPLEGFRKLVKELNALSLTIRIENARLETGRQAFDHLVVDVIRLADQIQDKSKTMRKQIQALMKSSEKEFNDILKLESRQHQRTNLILEDVNSQLTDLVNEREAASDRSHSLATEIDNISKDVGKVILSLQFHDIVRQMIEHVCQALEELEGEGDSPSVSAHDRAHRLLLQAAQLDDARRKVLAASGQIKDSLMQTGIHMEQILKISQKGLKSANGQGDNSLNSVREGINNISEALEETVRGGFEVRQLIRQIIDMVRKTGSFVTDIDEIGSEIELVAQNGVIHAAHLGEAGNGLSVLADAIQRLSAASNNNIVVVTDHLTGIVSKTDAMNLDNSDETDRTASLNIVETMSEDLFTLVQTLERVNQEVMSLLYNVDFMAEDFNSDINELVRSIKIETAFEEVLGTCIQRLESMARELVPDEELSSVDREALKSLGQRYTMDSERDIHESFIDSLDTAGAETPDEPVSVAVDDDSAWDDNIELF